MVVELRLLAIAGNFVLRLVYIAGTHMIGIDALARGELQTGALAKATMTHTIPLHCHPIERSSEPTEWMSSWVPSFSVTSPEDWFFRA